MKLKLIYGVLLYALLMFSVGCGADSSNNNPASSSDVASNSTEKNKVYLISKETTDIFWKDVDEGCKRRANELGNIDYHWIAPVREDPVQQAGFIDQAVSEGAKVILVAASSVDKLNESLEKADKAGVKIVYIDAAASYEAVASVMTDSNAAGKIAGETMLKILQDAGIQSGTVGVVSDFAESPNLHKRVAGFRSAFEGTPYDLSETFYARPDTQAFKAEIANHPDYVGFFSDDLISSFELSEQIKASGTNQIIVAFDMSDAIADMMKNGVISAAIQQNAKGMGMDAMDIAAKILDGTFTDKNFVKYTDVIVFTRDDIEQ